VSDEEDDEKDQEQEEKPQVGLTTDGDLSWGFPQ
jgi:hypothetical protein